MICQRVFIGVHGFGEPSRMIMIGETFTSSRSEWLIKYGYAIAKKILENKAIQVLEIG